MSRSVQWAATAAFVLIGMTAYGLVHLQSLQRLGTPGLRVVPHNVLREDGSIACSNSVPLPEAVLDFTSKEERIAKVVTDWLPQDTVYAQRTYQAPDGFWVQANVVLMGTDRTSIHKPEYCLAGQGFTTERIAFDTVRIAEPHPYELPILKMSLHREGTAPNGAKVKQSALYVYWFVADGQLTADHNQRMWWMARDLVSRGLLQRWGYVSCWAACGPDGEAAAYARVRQWIAAAVPQFQIATRPAVAGSPSP
jgi:hypothetical protein